MKKVWTYKSYFLIISLWIMIVSFFLGLIFWWICVKNNIFNQTSELILLNVFHYNLTFYKVWNIIDFYVQLVRIYNNTSINNYRNDHIFLNIFYKYLTLHVFIFKFFTWDDNYHIIFFCALSIHIYGKHFLGNLF
jgi:hypothetical protein